MKGLVWGYTFSDGISKMEEIEQNYRHIGINTIRKNISKTNYWIEFDNGDLWRVVRSNESARGYKANISYVDARIDPDFVCTVIRYSTYLPPYNAIRYFYPPRDCWPGDDEENETKVK